MLIEKNIQGGSALTRLPNGLVCFVEGALPGESVEVEIIEQKKDFAKAVISKILSPHEKRRIPPCPYYGKCGGCNAQHAEFELQIEILQQIVFDLFLRIAKLNLPQNFKIHSGNQWNYRQRAQVFKTNNDKIPWGFLERASNNVVPIEKCFVLSEKINQKLNEKSNFKKLYLFDNQSEKFLGKHIHADETVFFQSNLEMLSKLIDFVKDAAGEGAMLLDIFSGAGLFSAFLQDKFESVLAVEENPICQKFAKKNLNANCKFYAESAENFFSRNSLDLSKACVIIDPPRPGLTNNLCNFLCKAKIQKLIYVSCNPATLARDTRKFLNAGYKLANIHGFAFYPQTFHLEMLAEFNF
ncbi:MAG: TRAM domain-containing protein [Fibromonadaceae bacterium]|jgi:23S rRNA (uracil1939-C5)-methyltransferase|nr:TRAM domain-containing protein [Fibromonadaceae bacterium]